VSYELTADSPNDNTWGTNGHWQGGAGGYDDGTYYDENDDGTNDNGDNDCTGADCGNEDDWNTIDDWANDGTNDDD